MEEVWKIVYDSFEGSAHAGARTAMGMSAMRNEVQFRLQKAISDYRSQPSEKLLNTIEADTQLCNSMGYITDESTNKILDILEKLH